MTDKMVITPLGGTGIPVMFNPNTYRLNKNVSWSPGGDRPRCIKPGQEQPCIEPDRFVNATKLEFHGGGNRTLSFELFFDVTEKTGKDRDVRVFTDQIVNLSRMVRENEAPPVCEVSWGKESLDFPFQGVLTSVNQTLKLFDPDGTPLRATLDLTFTEDLERKKDLKKTDPEMTTRIVRRGDTLASIAAEVYRNPALWRVIAEANRLEDPFRLPAGLKLALPKR